VIVNFQLIIDSLDQITKDEFSDEVPVPN